MQAPENTLPAFKLARDLGADGIELDVRLSLDGVAMVIHDASVDKTTDGTGLVRSKTLAELRELDAGDHFSARFAGIQIPTLDEVLEEIGQQLLINVEIKGSGSDRRLVETVVDTINKHDLANRVMFSSFDLLLLRQARLMAPNIPIGYLYACELLFPQVRGWLAGSILGRCQAHHPHFASVTKHYMDWARREHVWVHVWTVNDADDMRRMCDLGVDMIMSDYPDRVRNVLSLYNQLGNT
ncbi:MAG: glycerophosphodiester phosphodiesterase [Anaerolineae bacterium]|nr:glycerophosphodiester phosphodiesterase [Anaerolineae bacterium]